MQLGIGARLKQLRLPFAWLDGGITGMRTWLLFALFRLLSRLSPEQAARLMGALFVRFGPRSSRHPWMLENLGLAFPEKTPAEVKSMATQCWRNFGCVMGEFPHLKTIIKTDRLRYADYYDLPKAMQRQEQHIYFSAHVANWELILGGLIELGAEPMLLSAPLRNAALDMLCRKMRMAIKGAHYIDRNKGMSALLRHFKAGKSIGLLADLRMKQGGADVPFFGRNIKSSLLAAKLAWRSDCKLMPVCMVRQGAGKLTLEVHPPLTLLPKIQAERDIWVLDTTARISARVESFIRQQPEHWRCTNRIWDKTLYQHKRKS